MINIVKQDNVDGYIKIKPVICTLEDVYNDDRLYNRYIYYKECIINEKNCLEIHYISDDTITFETGKPIEGFVAFFVSELTERTGWLIEDF